MYSGSQIDCKNRPNLCDIPTKGMPADFCSMSTLLKPVKTDLPKPEWRRGRNVRPDQSSLWAAAGVVLI